MKKSKYKPQRLYQYTLLDEITASPKEPMSDWNREYQLARIKHALKNIESAANPSPTDWRVCSDAINLMETLIVHNNGTWLDCDGDPVEIKDNSGLLKDAIAGMAMAGKRATEGKPIRLDGLGMQAVRAVVEDYEGMVQALPARTIIKAFRITERRIMDLLSGKKRIPNDVEVMMI